MRLNKGLEAGVLLAQGVLAGLTLASIYTMALAESLESFVAAYEVRMGSHVRLLVLVFSKPPRYRCGPSPGPAWPLVYELQTAVAARAKAIKKFATSRVISLIR